MDRRAFITVVGRSIVAAPLAGEAQQRDRIPRMGLKTAKALGLTIPQSLLLRADQVIQ